MCIFNAAQCIFIMMHLLRIWPVVDLKGFILCKDNIMGVGFINIYKVGFAETCYFRHYKNLDSLFLVKQ